MRNKPGQGPFTTIDDCLRISQELTDRLSQLGGYKYPLDVRRGMRKGVVDLMPDDQSSKQIRAGSRTYFFDVERTKEEGKPYLKITESRFRGKGKERERNSIVVFPEHVQEFAQAVANAATQLQSQ